MRRGKRLLCGVLALLMGLSLLAAGTVQRAYATKTDEEKTAEEQKKASDDTATTQPAEEPKAEETPEPVVEAKTGVDYPSYSLEPTDGWKPGTRSMNEKYEECEFTLGDDTFAFIDIRTYKTEPTTEAEARMGSKKDGTIDEVDVNGITWVRHTASNGTVNLFTKAPSGMTVGVVIGSKVDWNDALPMIENIILK